MAEIDLIIEGENNRGEDMEKEMEKRKRKAKNKAKWSM